MAALAEVRWRGVASEAVGKGQVSFDLDLEQRVRIGMAGLGYVGLPLAVKLAERYPNLGFDINAARAAELPEGRNSSLEVEPKDLRAALQQRRAGYLGR